MRTQVFQPPALHLFYPSTLPYIPSKNELSTAIWVKGPECTNSSHRNFLSLCFCFSFSTMGGIFRIHHSFHTKTRSIQQSPVSESFLPYAWTPATGQFCPGAHAGPAETPAGPHCGLRLSILLTPFLFLTLSKTLVLLSQCPLPRGPS